MSGTKEHRHPKDRDHQHEHTAAGKFIHDEVEERGRGRILTVRANSGLSGDMLVAGLLRMTKTDEAETEMSHIAMQCCGY